MKLRILHISLYHRNTNDCDEAQIHKNNRIEVTMWVHMFWLTISHSIEKSVETSQSNRFAFICSYRINFATPKWHQCQHSSTAALNSILCLFLFSRRTSWEWQKSFFHMKFWCDKIVLFCRLTSQLFVTQFTDAT